MRGRISEEPPMTHLWVRAEERPHEERVGLTPDGAAELIAAGIDVTVEESRQRAIPIAGYRDSGCAIAPEGSWPKAPADALVFGLKELPEDDTPLIHRHIMFGHAFKGQPAGRRLLGRFRAGGGRLYDLEYLTDKTDRRVAAFGYWAGYAGAAVALKCWAAQRRGTIAGPVGVYAGREALLADLSAAISRRPENDPHGADHRGAWAGWAEAPPISAPRWASMSTRWDMAETAHGGPFPEILAHDIFLNCILAGPEHAGLHPRRRPRPL
jgi:saccharopine dehydrogenase (NAD+, L-lysine-forming)